jgi:hypothetical protein
MRKNVFVFSLFVVVMTGGCRGCDGPIDAAARAELRPAILDLGPVTNGTSCEATLQLANVGRDDLDVGEATLTDANGSFAILLKPSTVFFGTEASVVVFYEAGTEVGERESATLQIATSDPDPAKEDGKVFSSISAIVADDPVPVAKSECDPAVDANAELGGCQGLNFGAVVTSDALVPVLERTGRDLAVTIVNDGTADMVLPALPVINVGQGEFAVLAVRRGAVEHNFANGPLTIPAGRTLGEGGACGGVADVDNKAFVDVRFAPGAIGAFAGELVVLSDAAESDGVPGGTLRVSLSGTGSSTGLVITPDRITLTANVGEENLGTTIVANAGTADAPVNDTCLDVNGNGDCDVGTDAFCSGAPDQTAYDGTLRCRVRTADDGVEGKGFVLAPTDGVAGGGDERTIRVEWTPTDGTACLPATTLLVKTAILNDRIYQVPVVGGDLGQLGFDTNCASGVCIDATGDPENTQSWTGSIEVTLTNPGSCSLQILDVLPESDTPTTIADDFVISAVPTSVAPGGEATFTVTYDNNDASQVDPINLIVRNTGSQSNMLVPVVVVAPQ